MTETNFFEQENRHGFENEEVIREEKISVWQVALIVLALTVMFASAALVIKSLYFKPPVVRTAAEREIVKFKTLVDNNPKNIDAYVGLAGVYLEIKEPEKAIDELKRAIEIDPRSWKANIELGIAYETLNNSELAVSYYRKASEIDPNNEYSYYQIGRLFHKQKNYGPAISAYKKTLAVNSGLSDVHYYLGLCYEKTNKKKLAKTEFTEALKYVEDFKEARAALERMEK